MDQQQPQQPPRDDRRPVPPLLDLSGWTAPQRPTPSADGQLPIAGLEAIERERKWRRQRGSQSGQQHLF